jgi:hypothetical protein
MMTTGRDVHASDAMVGPHGSDDHGEDHGHDDHAHGAGEALGPVDVTIWAAGALGIVGGLIVAAVLVVGAGWAG